MPTFENARVVHVIDAFSQSNHGIIEAALGTAEILREHYNIESELWYPEGSQILHQTNTRKSSLTSFPRGSTERILSLAKDRELKTNKTIIMTHGCWQAPTQIGRVLAKEGFQWVYVPHGMLEPWSLRQKRLKKLIYWKLREYPSARNATCIRATAFPEYHNLCHSFDNVELIPHGINTNQRSFHEEATSPLRFLFMGRLHHKKGPVPLAKAWKKTSLFCNPEFELLIVGNDNGQKSRLIEVIGDEPTNIRLLDPVYGAEKTKLLSSCDFFVLPSHSEGFPMALLEGMSTGLIPIITEGCNLPEALDRDVAFRITPRIDDIKDGLETAASLPRTEIPERKTDTISFVKKHYSLTAIAKKQAKLYQSLLPG